MQKGDGVMDQKKWKKQSLNVVIGSMISFMMFNFLTTVSVNIFIPAVAEMKNMGTAPLYNANTIGNLVSVLIALAIGMLSQKISLKKIVLVHLPQRYADFQETFGQNASFGFLKINSPLPNCGN